MIVKITVVSAVLLLLLTAVSVIGLGLGSSGTSFTVIFDAVRGKTESGSALAIVWRLRLPRVLLGILAGAVLSSGGLVFQAILKNPLAEPYILGISGGAALGAITGILAGFSDTVGINILAFFGSTATLLIVLVLSSGKSNLKKDSLLMAGVMVNAFCSAVILFLISLSTGSKLHSILFWLMGDLSMADFHKVKFLAVVAVPCLALVFALSHLMNLLLLGKDLASTMGINASRATFLLLIVTSLMISAVVCQCGLLGFVGLVVPHLFRMAIGPDHRVLVPACILGGGAFMVICDVLARTLPKQGEMPVGVVTAMVGAPLFIYLLKRRGS